ncbi:N-acetylglucosamine-6-phosphate deacetylase [Microvirga tunisiensis]|uniref:N-acetylglucosamine-6-phosphate deacetylase n=1 Tax=Pannonibacter tanglangensis TaxID=2750084 RepID=A0A7X5F0P0_9HYPH|nr:N-acetylglucosamine-6-phosphate deacetylase [Pannonibacter sp. XCT-53]NBN77601.1 N-acetylglucosamine-6-phosphate deacetylase [Pannonibacter sp. XCT-53]
MRLVFTGARLFDGQRLLEGRALLVEDGRIAGFADLASAEAGAFGGEHIALAGGVLAPGFLDLQVNGGDGIMVDGSADVERLRRICAAHLRLGATGILPTLITDTRAATAAVLAAGSAAARAAVPGFLGLHLEGPHLDPRRKGAHDPALIRPMDESDLAMLCQAAAELPVLLVTLAPQSVTPEQIAALSRAGVIVSLGHTDSTAAEAKAAFAAGARCVTHLFNAMSQLGNREPGMVGATLDSDVFCGIITDGVHVAPEGLRIALAAKRGEGLFLVSDAMAAAGTDVAEFMLGGRRILRANGRLTLEDGTLAGADICLPRSIRYLVQTVGAPLDLALAMATSRPAACIGASDRLGALAKGRRADLVHLTGDLELAGVWHAGAPVPGVT